MNRLECSALRSMAIVSIMLHNFSHWLPGAVPENEFSFRLDHYEAFWESVISWDFLIQIFSFFGHLGVPVFVFLTGYGLAQKYDRMEQLERKSFLYNHWKKLFIPLVVGIILYHFVMLVLEGHLACSLPRIFAQFTRLLNFISPMHLLPVPYWYLGMTMQLYIIYLLMIHKRSLTALILATILSLLFMVCIVDYPQALLVAKYNFVGWLVPLCMGIAYSRYQAKIRIVKGIRLAGALGISLGLFLLCGFNYYTWLLTPLFIVILAVGIVKYMPIRLQQKTDYVGRNSLYFLIVHPITRELIMPFAPNLGRYVSLLVYLLITFFVVYMFLYAKKKIELI